MKILHIIDHLGQGGARTIVESLIKNNNNQMVLSLRKKINEPILDNQTSKRVFIYPSNSKYNLGCLNFTKNLLKKNKDISILHCHDIKSYIVGYLMNKIYFKDKKLIFHEHGRIFTNKILYNYFLNKSQKDVDYFIAVSKVTSDKLVENANINKNKIRVLYNFINSFRQQKYLKLNFKKNIKRFEIKKDQFVIGFMGRLNKIKGCDVLIKSLPLINSKYKLIISGDGPEMKNLKVLSKNLKVDKNVLFIGYYNKPEEIYGILDVLIVPSRSESFGLSAVEGQSMGIPIIGSNLEGLRDSLGESGYIRFEKDNHIQLAEKINYLIKNKIIKNKLIKKGLERSKLYSYDNFIKNLDNLYGSFK